MQQRLASTSAAPRIHPTAQVSPLARLAPGVDVGPFAIVEPGARIGERTRVLAHAHICGPTEIGADCEVHMGAVLGHTPQIRDFDGPGGRLQIGPRTVIREQVTVHRASKPQAQTTIGSDVLLLSHCHVAHDCQVGDGATIASNSLLAGFVTVGAQAFISGNVGVHQFVRIGELAIIGGNARVVKDVPPFMMVVGNSRVRGLNVVGMRRAGLPQDVRQRVREAYGILYRSGLGVSDALMRLRDLPPLPEIDTLIAFIETSVRGLCGGRRRRIPHLNSSELPD